MNNERDTHFLGAAQLLYPDLKKLFTAYYEQRFFENEQGMEQVVEQTKTLIAQYSYDLTLHVLICDATENLNWIPDMTAWPPIPTEQE